MEFVIFAFFGFIAAILTYISASAEESGFVMPTFAGILFMLLGLSLTINGLDITYSAPFYNSTSNITAVALHTVNHYDSLFMNSFGIIFILFGVALTFSGLSHYSVKE